MEQDIFDKIKEVSEHAAVSPTSAVWDRLEKRLEAEKESVPPPTKFSSFFSIRRFSIAASVLVLIGAYGILNHLGENSNTSAAIQLEDLHTLEVNPRYNVSPVGESSTIPSIRMARSINTTYKGIDEGSVDKKLIERRKFSGKNTEYGLG